MNKLSLLLTALLSLLVASCGHRNDIIIEGTLENASGKTIYISEQTPESHILLDSIVLDRKGHFKFRHAMPYRTFINVSLSDNDFIVLLPDFGEKVKFIGDCRSLHTTYRIQGGGESLLLWQLQNQTNKSDSVIHELIATSNKNKALLSDGDMSELEYACEKRITDSLFWNEYSSFQQYVVHFIEDNLGSLSTLIALYKEFNGRIPIINPNDSFEFYEGVLIGLQETLPDNPHTLHFQNEVERDRFHYAR